MGWERRLSEAQPGKRQHQWYYRFIYSMSTCIMKQNSPYPSGPTSSTWSTNFPNLGPTFNLQVAAWGPLNSEGSHGTKRGGSRVLASPIEEGSCVLQVYADHWRADQQEHNVARLQKREGNDCYVH